MNLCLTSSYGDFVPTTEYSRCVMAFWSLAGLVLVGIFGGVVASGLSVGTLDNDIKIYGSTVFIYFCCPVTFFTQFLLKCSYSTAFHLVLCFPKIKMITSNVEDTIFFLEIKVFLLGIS